MKKIAFCFLTYDNLNHPNLWNKYLKNNEKFCNIYIHNKNEFIDNKNNFQNKCLKNTISTKWGHISLVKATLLLFNEALKDEENEYFILLSNSCIPLIKFSELYNYLSKTDSNILKSRTYKHLNRWNSIYNKKVITRSNFKKQHQWCCLKRETVLFFLNNTYFLNYFGINSEIPDEHYFITIIEMFKIPYKDQLMTYVDFDNYSKTDKNFLKINNSDMFCKWKNNLKNGSVNPHPKYFKNLTNDLILDIKKKNPNILFMRKIDKKCNLCSYFNKIL